MKNFFFLSFFIFLLIGCGGGSYSNINNTSSSAPKLGKGYYVDAPISGVSYQCGLQKGYTKENGEFTFEIGKDCIFSLGNIILRKVDKKMLQKEVVIFENNKTIEQLLLSLDIDGNNSNGIQITKDEIKIIQNSHITTITKENIQTLLSDINNTLNDFKGVIKDLEDVFNHFKDTFKNKLTNKTFYAVSDDDNKSFYAKIEFNQDLSLLTLTNLKNNSSIDIAISFSNNKLSFSDSNHSYSLTLISATDEAIVAALTIDDEEKIVKFFYDEKKAKLFYQSKKKIDASNYNLKDLRQAINNKEVAGYSNTLSKKEQYLAVINYLRSLPIKCKDSQAIIGPSPALNWDNNLEAAAIEHSNDMANNNLFSHKGSNGSSAVERIQNHGFKGYSYGENIAWIGKSGIGVTYDGNEWQEAFINLLHSNKGHCSNIMNPNFNYFGMAEAKKNSNNNLKIYWTQDFGRK